MTFQKGNKVNQTHGLRRTTEYRSWYHAKQRCTNPNHIGWKLYGGRGITMCDRWLNDFGQFYKDMGTKPDARFSLERIDTNRGYFPANCKWASPTEQNRNKRNSKLSSELVKKIVESPMSHKEAASYFGVSYHTVWDVRKGRSWKGIDNDDPSS